MKSKVEGHYDLVAVGGGPAGQRAAIQAAKLGARSALIDRRPRVGGVSLHTGTIPSKTLREAVIYLSGLRQRNYYGTSYKLQEEISLWDLDLRVHKVLRKELEVMDGQLQRNGVEMIQGQASFEDEHTLIISRLDEGIVGRITADKIVLAVGTVPQRLEDIPFDYEVIYDSNFLFSAKNIRKTLPKSLIIVGGGVIGTEYACMFAALGCQVILLDRGDKLLRFLDDDINRLLLQIMQDSGIQFRLNDEIDTIERVGDYGSLLTKKGTALKADAILMATGRRPCSFTLALENTRLRPNKKGLIEVNENFQTSIDHIYAAGDVIGFPALASTSSEQGRMAATHALGYTVQARQALFPFAIYTIPEVSMVGKTERQIIEDGTPYCDGIAIYEELPKAAIIGDLKGALKILFHRETHEILGVHMIGELASELLHIGVMVMNQKGRLELFIENVFNYPTIAEAYKIAAFNGLNKLTGTTHGPDIYPNG